MRYNASQLIDRLKLHGLSVKHYEPDPDSDGRWAYLHRIEIPIGQASPLAAIRALPVDDPRLDPWFVRDYEPEDGESVCTMLVQAVPYHGPAIAINIVGNSVAGVYEAFAAMQDEILGELYGVQSFYPLFN